MSVNSTVSKTVAIAKEGVQKLVRCGWVTSDPLYLEYHDNEWGRPSRDRRHLFEMISLEGQQAGLSWITILKKRHVYKTSFHDFDVDKVSAMTADDINRLLTNPGIIRHRGKLESIINNAKIVQSMEKKGESLVDFFWSFSPNNNNKSTYYNQFDGLSKVPATSSESDRMSMELKKRGFKFVGSTTCYSFIQACGLVNDHVTNCFCHNPIKKNISTVDTTSTLSIDLTTEAEVQQITSNDEEEDKESDDQDSIKKRKKTNTKYTSSKTTSRSKKVRT